MNEEYLPNLDISLSGFQDQNPQPFDSFDVSVEYQDKRPSFNPFSENPQQNILSPLQANENANSSSPPNIISSISSANPPTQGEIQASIERQVHPTTFGGIPPDQHPNQSQSQDNRENRARPQDNDHPIFSFRRDQNQASPEQNNRDVESGENNENNQEPVSPTVERDSYERTRVLFTRLKKYYVYYFLNVLCVGLLAFNIVEAYSTEGITFPKFEALQEQFQKKVVLDFNVVAPGENCKDLYTPIKMGTWPGLKQLCKCSIGSFFRACDASELQSGCQNMGEYKTVSGQYWDGKKICIRKSEKSFIEYYESSGFMESYSGNLLCPNSQKKCVMSSSKNFVCVGRLDSCPVSQIEIIPNEDQLITKLRAKVFLENKILAFDTQATNATSTMDFIVESADCSRDDSGLQAEDREKYCSNEQYKRLIDTEGEYKYIVDNSGWTPDVYQSFENSTGEMKLYAVSMNYLDMCAFNSSFNPVVISNQLSNWKVVKYLLFINPYFMTTILVLNILRALMITYINTPVTDRVLQRRKKEIYNMFGSAFGGSSLVATAEILTMLYYIFWGYLLLNPDRLLAEKWLMMNCIDSDVRTELQYMVQQFLKIESYNMVVIAPMIFGCVMEAIFAQFRLMIRPYNRISRDDQSMRE